LGKVSVEISSGSTFYLDEIDEVARHIIEVGKGLNVWIFIGEMGVGKTTLIKSIAKELAVKEIVQSPTFSIVNEYAAQNGKVFHFDFYRIKNEEEAYDIGTDEYFESGEFCLVEWPNKIPSLLPNQYFEIRIFQESNSSRKIEYTRHE